MIEAGLTINYGDHKLEGKRKVKGQKQAIHRIAGIKQK